MARYKVTLAKNYRNPTYWRGGRQFTRGEEQILELDKDQVKVFKDDKYISISKASSKSEGNDVGTSEGSVQDSGATTTTDTAPTTDQTTPSVPSEGEGSQSGAQAQERDKLLQKKRDKLNKLAVDAGIDSPDQLPNKEAVVDALLAKQEG